MLKKLKSKSSFKQAKRDEEEADDDAVSLSTLETGTLRSRINDAPR
jgi:hypothetical protein